ncbi:unnamed protein product, partial [Lymnaea stagnalis]
MARRHGMSSARKFHIHAFLVLVFSCVALAQYQTQSSAYPASTGYQGYAQPSAAYQPSTGYQPYSQASYPAYGQQPAYGSYGYNAMRPLVQSDVKNCTDTDCGQDECCVSTPRASICAKMISIDTSQLVCARVKRCGSDADCFSPNGCCVYNPYATADVTSPPPPDYYKYPPSSRPGQIVPPLVGVCLPALSLDN